VFTQLVLVSGHIPFAPVPPYLADWDDSATFASVPATAMEEVWRQPEWTRLAPDYLNSLRYDFAVLAGWLTHRASGDGLVIVGGEPQPPWTVPIHVLSRDPELVASSSPRVTSPASFQSRHRRPRAWRHFSRASWPGSTGPGDLQAPRGH
jgi:hypothetical protein